MNTENNVVPFSSVDQMNQTIRKFREDAEALEIAAMAVERARDRITGARVTRLSANGSAKNAATAAAQWAYCEDHGKKHRIKDWAKFHPVSEMKKKAA